MADIKAPAKINLTLEVLGERPDGFHEIRSVIQTIDLYDSLRFRSNRQLSFSCDNPEFIIEESLVSRAAALLQEVGGFSRGATVDIKKRIPLVAGLGGDSSDAAAVLSGLNKLWKLGLSPERLLELAPKLGSDVAFFLYGGTALVKGRGEEVTALPPLPRRWVVLMVPPFSRMAEKTRKLYASLKSSHYTDGQITEKLVKALNERRGFKPSMLFNTFENTAFELFPKLKLYRDHFIKLGAYNVHLAGSGPALFAMPDDKMQAENLYARCQLQGLECYLAETTDSKGGIK
ncbi:MAG: 4-(cytidine 5'-diphospho)-2-C-methyl-D-erythritol kinase [Deltaproteobacteria bacterium]|nr:4-(cytidine 5'-diphospho)-2-C-methyl-D-erythritol kinase [Deltaproteobacteria bacterium]